MKASISSFLEFKGHKLLYVAEEGQYHIAVKPICEALNVVYTGQLKTMQKDPILGPALYLRTIQVPNSQGRQMTCIPERYVYGWLFGIKSKKSELIDFKRECYDVMFNHFNGAIGGRKELLKQKSMITRQINSIESRLAEDQQHQEYIKLKNQLKSVKSDLTQLDNKVIKAQQELWDN